MPIENCADTLVYRKAAINVPVLATGSPDLDRAQAQSMCQDAMRVVDAICRSLSKFGIYRFSSIWVRARIANLGLFERMMS